jgi:hypothetical protein
MKFFFITSILLILILFSPTFILGEESWVLIHDNLDSEFVYLHLLKKSNNLFSLNGTGIVSQVFNGLATDFFHSEFSFIRVLFWLLPSFWAYVLNSFIVRLIGVVGMLLLLTTYFEELKIPKILYILIPVSFGLLPIYSLYGLSVMGQPLLAWSFLNLKLKTKLIISYIIIVLFPFYSHFAMVAPFILFAIILYGGGLFMAKSRISANYFIGIGGLFVSYILANYFTIENFIYDNVVSHRESWHFEGEGFNDIVVVFFNTLLYGQYHSSIIFGFPVLLLGLYLISKKVKSYRTIGLITLSILLITLFHSIYRNISSSLEDHLHILTSFNFSRFTFLLPFLYYLLLIKCLSFFTYTKIQSMVVVLIFFSANLYFNNEIKFNVAKLILPETETNIITTFSKFYSEDVFKKVNKYIGLPQENYRVVSLGIHPSIAQYNGFYTLDSYQNNYPLSYKKEFRKIIEEELDKSQDLKDYYDNWGSRCYLFSSELHQTCYLNCSKYNCASVNQLKINTEILKQMGSRYILSAVNILNAEDLDLKLERTFESNQSHYKIYLFRL